VLPRLAYLGVTNAFALPRPLPMSDRDKDSEILALRHQLAALQRQLAPHRVRFTPSDRVMLAALLHHHHVGHVPGLPSRRAARVWLIRVCSRQGQDCGAPPVKSASNWRSSNAHAA
jgi:hypothetical protein